MTDLQEKTIDHVKDLLDKFTTFHVRDYVYKKLDECNIPENVQTNIIIGLDKELNKLSGSIIEASSWIGCIQNEPK